MLISVLFRLRRNYKFGSSPADFFAAGVTSLLCHKEETPARFGQAGHC